MTWGYAWPDKELDSDLILLMTRIYSVYVYTVFPVVPCHCIRYGMNNLGTENDNQTMINLA